MPRTFRINCSLTNYTPVSSFTQPYNIYSIYSIYHVYNMLQLASWLPRRPLGTKSLSTNLSLIQNTDLSPPAKTIAGGERFIYVSYAIPELFLFINFYVLLHISSFAWQTENLVTDSESLIHNEHFDILHEIFCYWGVPVQIF